MRQRWNEVVAAALAAACMAQVAAAATPPATRGIIFQDDSIRVLRLTDVAELPVSGPGPALWVIDAGECAAAVEGATTRQQPAAARSEAVDWPAPLFVQQPRRSALPMRCVAHANAVLRAIRVEMKNGVVPHLLPPPWPRGQVPVSSDGSDPRGWDPQLDSPVAAPDFQKLVYEDAFIRVIAVAMPVDRAEPLHHHPYPTVWMLYGPRPAVTEDTDITGRKRLQRLDGVGAAATVMLLPPGAPHSSRALTAGNRILRIEFKRLP